MNACMTNAPPERRNHKRSAAPPHRSCGACRSRISRDARFCASSSNAAATREEAPRPTPPPPPGRTPVVCMMQTKKMWALFPSFPRASFQAPLSFFLSSSFFLLFFLKYSSAHHRSWSTRRFTMDWWFFFRALSSAVPSLSFRSRFGFPLSSSRTAASFPL